MHPYALKKSHSFSAIGEKNGNFFMEINRDRIYRHLSSHYMCLCVGV